MPQEFDWAGAAGTQNRVKLSGTETHTTSLGFIKHESNTMWPDIRCDQMVNGSTYGCVFPDYTPDLIIDYKKRPGAAAFYWAIQEKLPTRPGSKRFNSPLHREADAGTVQTNRNFMCDHAPAQWVGNPASKDPKDNTIRGNPSCDEYPFARSKESGGQSQVYGTSCAQLMVEAIVDNSTTPSTVTWKLQDNQVPGTAYYDLPTWNEPCGRASVLLNQNSNAGSDLGNMTKAQRLLDNDAYYVVIPQLAGCTFESICDLRPRP